MCIRDSAVIAQWKTQFEALKLKDIDVEKLYEVGSQPIGRQADMREGLGRTLAHSTP